MPRHNANHQQATKRAVPRSIAARLCVLIALWLGASLIAAQETPLTSTPTNTPPPPPPQVLTIWWPEALVRDDSAGTLDVLEEQSRNFAANQENVLIETRIKRSNGEVGSLMSTLRSASAVAPGALPDVTLMRRQDMLTAFSSGLIQPLETLVASATLGNLGQTLLLGQIEGELVGLPYVVDLLHVAYRPVADLMYDSWSFDDFLERAQPLLMPAGRTTGINSVLLLQYLDAGGSLARDNTLLANADALRTVLSFYASASTRNLITPDALNYLTPTDYLTSFSSGDADSAVVRSTTFMRLQRDEPGLEAASIPTASGDAITSLEGWMWVLVASDSTQQETAMRYINWMMEPERQAAYANTILMLPSQRSALQRSLLENATVELYTEMLDNAVLQPTSEGGPLAHNLQAAFAAVLTQESSVEDALTTINPAADS